MTIFFAGTFCCRELLLISFWQSLRGKLNVRTAGNGKEINEMFDIYKTCRIMPRRFVLNRND